MNVEVSREFVDTNVLVYAFDTSASEKNMVADHLIRTLWETRQGRLSVQVLQEFYVTVTSKLARSLSPHVAAELVADFSAWPIHAPTAEDVGAAIRIHQAYQLSFWDAMVLQSALQLDCSIVWSEDLSHLQRVQGITIKNPFARD